MIIWLTGNSGAGKSTLAKKLVDNKTVILDGDDLRYIWQDLDLSRKGREEQSLRTARLAKSIEAQGFNVIVAVICPYENLRSKVKKITNCQFIYLPYGKKNSEEYPYEKPINPDLVYRRKDD